MINYDGVRCVQMGKMAGGGARRESSESRRDENRVNNVRAKSEREGELREPKVKQVARNFCRIVNERAKFRDQHFVRFDQLTVGLNCLFRDFLVYLHYQITQTRRLKMFHISTYKFVDNSPRTGGGIFRLYIR